MITEALNDSFVNTYIGGRGFGARMLYDETPPGIDPLSAENRLIISAGPCNGTRVPGNSRLTLTAKSPMTNLYGSTNASGAFGAEIKYAGYDAIVIEGCSEAPVYLWIHDDRVEIRDARSLWGKTTQQTHYAMQRAVGHSDASVICIGPAGENLVRFACAISDIGRAFGKCGMGAVMGSKNLKGIAIRGTGGIEVANPHGLEEASRKLLKDWQSQTMKHKLRLKYGLSYLPRFVNDAGILPTRNFQSGTFPEGEPLYAEHVVQSHFLNKSKACFSCCVPCDKIHVITKGRFKGTWGTALEAGAQQWWGALIGNDNLDVVIRGACLCDMYGLDMVEMCTTLSWAMECFQRGIITLNDTGGIPLKWGDGDIALKLLSMVTFRQDFGDILAEGSKRAAERVGNGADEYAMQVKGAAIDAHDPRGSKGWGLGYAVASRGADHCMGMMQTELGRGLGWDTDLGEIRDGGKTVDPYSEKDKGTIRRWVEDIYAFINMMQICEFANLNFPVQGMADQLATFYNAVTGAAFTDEDVLKSGERTVAMEHAYNLREGWTRKDDCLPSRFLKETLKDGPAKGQVVDLDTMLREYYHARGWDDEGLPDRRQLSKLGLEDIAVELERRGQLAGS
ncbi:MAG: aldehyde ferredoxin oxidoreductase family protein [Deltaproteobacteria bacterium]|nr:aldehyde ferredoxin oxidoreductase family protein [Deltaproteobacteria bacterium]